MRKILFIWSLLCSAVILATNNTISIPLHMSSMAYMPMDSPTGSTPDPTDPNQFRASLTGNILHIETLKDAVSYVVIRETQSEQAGDDYFYTISYGSVDCTITHPGKYTILIGYWKTDFIGEIYVYSIKEYALTGAYIHPYPLIIRLETSLGITTSKICIRP